MCYELNYANMILIDQEAEFWRLDAAVCLCWQYFSSVFWAAGLACCAEQEIRLSVVFYSPEWSVRLFINERFSPYRVKPIGLLMDLIWRRVCWISCLTCAAPSVLRWRNDGAVTTRRERSATLQNMHRNSLWSRHLLKSPARYVKCIMNIFNWFK